MMIEERGAIFCVEEKRELVVIARFFRSERVRYDRGSVVSWVEERALRLRIEREEREEEGEGKAWGLRGRERG